MERILQLEYIICKQYQSLHIDYVKVAFALLEDCCYASYGKHFDMRIANNENLFKQKLKEYLSSSGKSTLISTLLRSEYPSFYQSDLLLIIWLDLITNFSEIIAHHLFTELHPKLTIPKYETLADRIIAKVNESTTDHN